MSNEHNLMWSEASRDVEFEERNLLLAKARVALADTWGFLSEASSTSEYQDRLALMDEQVSTTLSSVTPREDVHTEVLAAMESDFAKVLETRREAARHGDTQRGVRGSRKAASMSQDDAKAMFVSEGYDPEVVQEHIDTVMSWENVLQTGSDELWDADVEHIRQQLRRAPKTSSRKTASEVPLSMTWCGRELPPQDAEAHWDAGCAECIHAFEVSRGVTGSSKTASQWATIVHLQGDEGYDVVDIIREEGVQPAAEYLAQWDYGERDDVRDHEPWGYGYQTTPITVGGDDYVLAWSTDGSVSLNQKVGSRQASRKTSALRPASPGETRRYMAGRHVPGALLRQGKVMVREGSANRATGSVWVANQPPSKIPGYQPTGKTFDQPCDTCGKPVVFERYEAVGGYWTSEPVEPGAGSDHLSVWCSEHAPSRRQSSRKTSSLVPGERVLVNTRAGSGKEIIVFWLGGNRYQVALPPHPGGERIDFEGEVPWSKDMATIEAKRWVRENAKHYVDGYTSSRKTAADGPNPGGREIARWATPNGAYVVVLYQSEVDAKFGNYSYGAYERAQGWSTSRSSGSVIEAQGKDDQAAIAAMEAQINKYSPGGIGQFVPSSNKQGLERVSRKTASSQEWEADAWNSINEQSKGRGSGREIDCMYCNGTGKVGRRDCDRCGGTGLISLGRKATRKAPTPTDLAAKITVGKQDEAVLAAFTALRSMASRVGGVDGNAIVSHLLRVGSMDEGTRRQMKALLTPSKPRK